MSFIAPYRRLQPDLNTEQGSYENPFVPYSANAQLSRTTPMLWDLRGRHQYRVQPRQLGPGAMGMDGVELVDDDGATVYPGASSPYPPMPGVQGFGQGFGSYDDYLRSVQGFGQTAPAVPSTLTAFQIALLVGIVGVAAYFFGQYMAKKTRRNPVSCRRGWSGGHRAYLCAKCGAGRRRSRPAARLSSFQPKNRKLASKAKQQPRDASGRFV